MGKISKSDQPINRNEHAEAAEAAANRPTSQHFAVGTTVSGWREEFGRRIHWRNAEIVARSSGLILVVHEDGSTEILAPQALAFERPKGV